MWRASLAVGLGVALAGTVITSAVFAQHQHPAGSPPGHEHRAMPRHGAGAHGHHMRMQEVATVPTMPGQDAFGAIAEIVRMLEADPATDWSRVDLERLRQHLVDMHEVMLRSAVKAVAVPGGLAMDVTGTGRTEQAIRTMVIPHAAELDRSPEWSARTEPIASGVRLTVLARKPEDQKLVARIRGLGFAGLIVQGGHHQPHHLAMAKGETLAGHKH